MATREIILTMGKRENFMCNWFQFLPTEIKKEIMMKIPGWKRSCNLGDVVLFKGILGDECGVEGCIIDYIFNMQKKYYEYCFQIIDDKYLKIYPEKSVFWRGDCDFIKTGIYSKVREVKLDRLIKIEKFLRKN